MMNSEYNIVAWRTFRIRNYLCTPMKYPAILVPFPLNRPMFILWNSWYLDLNMEWGLWYIPEPKILYIILLAEIIWFTMGIFEISLKNMTLCVQHHAWISSLDNAPSKIFLQVEHSKLHQTWLYLIIFGWVYFFYMIQKSITNECSVFLIAIS